MGGDEGEVVIVGEPVRAGDLAVFGDGLVAGG